jgi:hypothetical protein
VYPVKNDQVDVRRQPLAVRDGCAPGRIPAARWPSDGALVRSEQFAVNEILAGLGWGQGDGDGDGGDRVFALHAPPGTGVAEVFGDLIAAVVTERARRIAGLPDPAAAFGAGLSWGPHVITRLAPELTGFEIVQSAPAELSTRTPGMVPAARTGTWSIRPAAGSAATGGPAVTLPPVGTKWRSRAARADYFASTARLSDGVGAWAMLVARLGDGPANQAFAERWWQGTMRGTDVLFPTGESMAAALRQLAGQPIDWGTAVTWFRSALAKVEALAAERAPAAAALTQLSLLEQACEEASCAADAVQAKVEQLAAREPASREAVRGAEEDYRAALAALGAHELSRPALNTVTSQGVSALQSREVMSVAMAGGVRRARNLRRWQVNRRARRATAAVTEQRLNEALREAEKLRVRVTAARSATEAAAAKVARLTAEMEPLAEIVAEARRRWGDHVPAGPSQAETEDPLLIEWRETTAPWADDEYATARAHAFVAALELHKALIAAQAGVFEANLAALMTLIAAPRTAGDGFDGSAPEDGALDDGVLDGGVLQVRALDGSVLDGSVADDTRNMPDDVRLALWQSFFLVVPVVQVPFEAAGTLFDGLGPDALGWLLAAGAEQLTAGAAPRLLDRFERAVCAGDALLAQENGTENGSGSGAQASSQARYGTWLPSAHPAGGSKPRWVTMPLRVVRGQDRTTIDERNDLAYDGLLISGRE